MLNEKIFLLYLNKSKATTDLENIIKYLDYQMLSLSVKRWFKAK